MLNIVWANFNLFISFLAFMVICFNSYLTPHRLRCAPYVVLFQHTYVYQLLIIIIHVTGKGGPVLRSAKIGFQIRQKVRFWDPGRKVLRSEMTGLEIAKNWIWDRKKNGLLGTGQKEQRGGGWAGAFQNVVVRKHVTHPFHLAQN